MRLPGTGFSRVFFLFSGTGIEMLSSDTDSDVELMIHLSLVWRRDTIITSIPHDSPFLVNPASGIDGLKSSNPDDDAWLV